MGDKAQNVHNKYWGSKVEKREEGPDQKLLVTRPSKKNSNSAPSPVKKPWFDRTRHWPKDGFQFPFVLNDLIRF